MAKAKTVPATVSVPAFIDGITDESRRNDSLRLIELLRAETGLEPRMWGGSIIGFGSYHYQYASGHSGDAALVGFSPRKEAISLYLAVEFNGSEELLSKLGKVKAGKGCIYIKKLSEVDEAVLRAMVRESVVFLKQQYPSQP